MERKPAYRFNIGIHCSIKSVVFVMLMKKVELRLRVIGRQADRIVCRVAVSSVCISYRHNWRGGVSLVHNIAGYIMGPVAFKQGAVSYFYSLVNLHILLHMHGYLVVGVIGNVTVLLQVT